MDLEGKSFRLEFGQVENWTQPGLDPDHFAREFRGSLFEGLVGAGLEPKTGADGHTDLTIHARVVKLDPGDKWGRAFFAPFAGAAVVEAEVSVGDDQSSWGMVRASGKRRFAWLEPNDDAVWMLADAARLAGKHAASRVVSMLRRR